MRRIVTTALMTVTLTLAAGAMTAGADPQTDIGFRGWGPRVGLTFDPDQVHVGAHMDFGNFGRHVRFQPNIDVGFGNDVTLITANADAAYRFSETWDVWTPYLGGGLGLVFASSNNDGPGDGSSTDFGVSILGGIEKGLTNGDRFFVESKVGITDHYPDLKLTVGWTFFH